MRHAAGTVSTDRLERALRTIAGIVAAPGGERYVAIFERLEREVQKRHGQQDAQARARRLALEGSDMRMHK